ncbi:hypothetical protein BTUL_0063g00330 [Botrytis tulipae]|uniref:Uncharacterized protein n=1 Tax=Botrytis tulipae TaxID=87230 RepID=A0A4Z1EXD3_9HELO|nr:hypothetical protein BTUL_0063g00330 [Botrytis tulipae]
MLFFETCELLSSFSPLRYLCTVCYHPSQMGIARMPSIQYRTPIDDMRLQSLLHNVYPPSIGGKEVFPED